MQNKFAGQLPRLAFCSFVLGAAVLAAPQASAQARWPNHAIRIVVPYAPGGSTDITARLVAKTLSQELGQAVVVDNKGGAGGTPGTAFFAKGPADDHSFLMVTQSQMSINQFLFKDKLGYDPVADLQPVGLVAQTTNVMVVPNSLPVKTFKEFIEYAKAHPGKLSYSSAGVGSTGHLSNELLKTKLGLDLVHVPYRGNGPAMQAVLSGEVQENIDNMPQLLAQVKGGRVRPLAVTTSKRWFQLPDVPTVDELGYPDLKTTVWFALMAQSHQSRETIAKMNAALNKALHDPEFVARLKEQSLEPTPSTPQDVLTLADSERKKWKSVVETSGATLD